MYLLDTNAVINYLGDTLPARAMQFMNAIVDDNCNISVITKMETLGFAFKSIAEAHHFPPDFPEVEMAVGLINYAFSAAGVYSVVAEENGQIAGSNFLWENGKIGGVGPIRVPCRLYKMWNRC